MKKPKYYLVFEPTTGFMDGFYFVEDIAVEMVYEWNKIRPEHNHILLITDEQFHLADDKYLPIIRRQDRSLELH